MKRSFFFKSLAVLALFGMSISSGIAQDDSNAPGSITQDGGPVIADNTGATPDGPQLTCWFDNAVEGDVWYAFTATSTGLTVFTTDIGGNNDTQLGLYEYDGSTFPILDGLTEVGCSDDNAADYMSTINYCEATIGNIYLIQCDGWQGTSGAFELEVVTNPDCVSCDPTGCSAGVIDDTTPQVVCFGDQATFSVSGWSAPTDPTACDPQGGMLMQPVDPLNPSGPLPGGFTWSNPDLTGAVDGIAANSFAGGTPMEGDWTMTPVSGINGSFANCDVSATSLLVTFVAQDDTVTCAPCDPSSCEAGDLVDNAGVTLCPAELTDVDAPVVLPGPTCAGDVVVTFDEGPGATGGLAGGFIITGIAGLPYAFDDDVNGIMSGNGLDPLRGTWFIGVAVRSQGLICDTTTSKRTVVFLDGTDPACSGPDCSVFDTAPVDLTKSFDPVDGVQDRVQVKWFKASPEVRYSDADAAACDIKFWAKRNLDPVTGAPVGPAIVNPDTVLIVDAKKSYPDNSPREIFKWPVKFRAAADNPNAKRADPNIRYEWQVRCACEHGAGQESPWSDVKIFNVPDFDPVTGIYTPPGGITPEVFVTKSFAPQVKGVSNLPEISAKRAYTAVAPLAKKTKMTPALAKSFTQADIKLYPNPANDVLNIVLDTEVSSVNIKDLAGRTIMQETGNGSMLQISTATLSDGMYMIEIEINGEITRKPFMVKK